MAIWIDANGKNRVGFLDWKSKIYRDMCGNWHDTRSTCGRKNISWDLGQYRQTGKIAHLQCAAFSAIEYGETEFYAWAVAYWS